MITTITATWRDEDCYPNRLRILCRDEDQMTREVGQIIANAARKGWTETSIRLTDETGRVRMLIRPRAGHAVSRASEGVYAGSDAGDDHADA